MKQQPFMVASLPRDGKGGYRFCTPADTKPQAQAIAQESSTYHAWPFGVFELIETHAKEQDA